MRPPLLATFLFLLNSSAIAQELPDGNLSLGISGTVSIEYLGNSGSYRIDNFLMEPPGVITRDSNCAIIPASMPSDCVDIDITTLDPDDKLACKPVVGLPLVTDMGSGAGCEMKLDPDPTTPEVEAFPKDTVFRFGICVHTSEDSTLYYCDAIFYTEWTQNSDGKDHAIWYETTAMNSPNPAYRLGWEDIYGGGDMDFDDMQLNLVVKGACPIWPNLSD
jgi:hypothetical protein